MILTTGKLRDKRRNKPIARLYAVALVIVMILFAKSDKLPTVVNAMSGPISGGNITNTGLDLKNAAPIVLTEYIAGSGTVTWDPDTNTLTLNNATINNNQDEPLIILPEEDVTINLIGENHLINLEEINMFPVLISQGQILFVMVDQETKEYGISIMGDGQLNLSVANKVTSISTDGELIINGGEVILNSSTSGRIQASRFEINSGLISISELGAVKELIINNGLIICTEGLFCRGDLTYNGEL